MAKPAKREVGREQALKAALLTRFRTELHGWTLDELRVLSALFQRNMDILHKKMTVRNDQFLQNGRA